MMIMYEISYLVRTQNFPKNYYFLSPDRLKHVCLTGGKRYKFFGKLCLRYKRMIANDEVKIV